jgi:hypothetical protein
MGDSMIIDNEKHHRVFVKQSATAHVINESNGLSALCFQFGNSPAQSSQFA